MKQILLISLILLPAIVMAQDQDQDQEKDQLKSIQPAYSKGATFLSLENAYYGPLGSGNTKVWRIGGSIGKYVSNYFGIGAGFQREGQDFGILQIKSTAIFLDFRVNIPLNYGVSLLFNFGPGYFHNSAQGNDLSYPYLSYTTEVEGYLLFAAPLLSYHLTDYFSLSLGPQLEYLLDDDIDMEIGDGLILCYKVSYYFTKGE